MDFALIFFIACLAFWAVFRGLTSAMAEQECSRSQLLGLISNWALFCLAEVSGVSWIRTHILRVARSLTDETEHQTDRP